MAKQDDVLQPWSAAQELESSECCRRGCLQTIKGLGRMNVLKTMWLT